MASVKFTAVGGGKYQTSADGNPVSSHVAERESLESGVNQLLQGKKSVEVHLDYTVLLELEGELAPTYTDPFLMNVLVGDARINESCLVAMDIRHGGRTGNMTFELVYGGMLIGSAANSIVPTDVLTEVEQLAVDVHVTYHDTNESFKVGSFTIEVHA